MGCDIHLRIERRKRESSNDRRAWCNVGFRGNFSSRIYGMFARMANVRSYCDKYKVQFEPRGLPEDMTDWCTCECFYMFVTDNEDAAEWGENYCLRESAEQWVKEGYSEWFGDDHGRVTDPDLHSYSWLTTQELRQCFDDCFKENGDYKPYSDYVDWLGVVSLCEGIESTGEFECRVVFAFDN